MDSFMLWFWRPIAETLGVFALLAVLFIGAFLWFVLQDIYQRISRKFKGNNK